MKDNHKNARPSIPGFALFALGWCVFYLYQHFATETDLGLGVWAWGTVGLCSAAAVSVWIFRTIRAHRSC